MTHLRSKKLLYTENQYFSISNELLRLNVYTLNSDTHISWIYDAAQEQFAYTVTAFCLNLVCWSIIMYSY